MLLDMHGHLSYTQVLGVKASKRSVPCPCTLRIRTMTNSILENYNIADRPSGCASRQVADVAEPFESTYLRGDAGLTTQSRMSSGDTLPKRHTAAYLQLPFSLPKDREFTAISNVNQRLLDIPGLFLAASMVSAHASTSPALIVLQAKR